MSVFIDAFFGLLLNRFFAYPLAFGLCVSCFALVFQLFKFKGGSGR